jgi:glutamine synthetase
VSRTSAGEAAGGAEATERPVSRLEAAGVRTALLGGADTNGVLAVTAALAAGLDGVARGLEPPPPGEGDLSAAGPALPGDLAAAADALAAGTLARDWLGDDLVDHLVALRRAEQAAADDAVTDRELARYLEAG